MTCPRDDDLSAYVDNMMPAELRDRFSAHLLACPICHHRLDELNVLQSDFRALAAPVLGFDLAARLEHQLRPAATRKPPVRSFWPGWVPAGLAVAALSSGVWLGALFIGGIAINAPTAAMVRVFDPVPPGGLCAAAELCRLSKGL